MSNKLDSIEVSVGDRRLEMAEKVSVFLAFGGSVVGFIFQKYFLVFAPISCALGLNLINRQKMLASVQQNYSMQIEALNHKHESHVTTTTKLREKQTRVFKDMEKSQADLHQKLEISKNKIKKLGLSLIDVNQVSKNLDDSISELNKQQKDIDVVVQELRVLGNSDDRESNDDSPANFYCKRGLIYHKRQKYQQALKDFNQAIKLDENFAPAYHHSGLTYLTLGNKRQAFESLRKASQLYFASNDLDKYHQVRKLSQKLYHAEGETDLESLNESSSLNTATESSSQSPSQKIAVDDLFS